MSGHDTPENISGSGTVLLVPDLIFVPEPGPNEAEVGHKGEDEGATDTEGYGRYSCV